MSDPFDNVNLLRILQETETVFDKPGSEEMLSQLRENWEVLMLLMLYTGTGGTATSDPPNDTTGYFYDTAAGWADDEHNGRSLVIIDGLAAGNIYEIDDTDDANDRLVCTGDNLYSDGVRSGDAYKIFYNLKHTSGHTHDNVDSPNVVLADSQVTQAKLKTSTGSSSRTTSGISNYTLPGGEYGFHVQEYLYNGNATQQHQGFLIGHHEISSNTWTPQNAPGYATASQASYVTIYNEASNMTTTVYIRYVTSSGEIHWIFILRDKATKNIIGIWEAPDHPCFGNGAKPEIIKHPFANYDPAIEEIIVINPDNQQLNQIRSRIINPDEKIADRIFNMVIKEDYNIEENNRPDWPDIPITVGLPPDWERLKIGDNISPIKKIIPQPADIKTARLILK